MFALLALTFAAAPVPKDEPADWKRVIKDRTFKFDDATTAWDKEVEAAKKAGLAVEFAAGEHFLTGEYTFAKKDGPKFTVSGHGRSVYVMRGDVLYFADYSPISSGCQIAAYDLTTGKKAWKMQLEGLGPIDHTKYRNRVVMSVEQHPTVKDAFALVITSWEAAGGYIEVRDLATGKQLALKKFETSELPKQ
jgi:hypothetical protein